MSDSVSAYPSHLLPKDKKDTNWILKYIKAAYNEGNGMSPHVFYFSRDYYDTIVDYAQGKQSVEKYKPLLGVDEATNNSYLAIDWNVLPIISKFITVALEKINKVDFNIVATPIDPMAVDEKDEFLATIKAKMALREQLAAQGIDPKEIPALQPTPGEPTDDEELEMMAKHTYKHRLAREMEQGVQLVFNQNRFSEERRKSKKNLFYFGVAGYKDTLLPNGMVEVRAIDPRNLISSFCRRPDFADARHIGEIVEMTISELRARCGTRFTEEQYYDIAQKCTGKWGNPSSIGESWRFNRNYDAFKIRVFDMEFKSVNDMVYETRINRRGNKVVGPTSFENRFKNSDKYKVVSTEVIYKGCWIIDTDYIFDEGLATDMKRTRDNLAKVQFSYHIQAYNFHDMRIVGKVEQIIPIADQIAMDWFHLQNVKNSALPAGIAIEMGALENIPLGKGGQNFTPLQVMDLFQKKGMLFYRQVAPNGQVATNYQPISEIRTSWAAEAEAYFQSIQNNIQLIRDILGMNELTDGSTPDPRMLTTTANAAIESSNNALSDVIYADQALLERLAGSVILRLQDAVKKGKVEGYLKGIGQSSVEFFTLSRDVAYKEYGIMLEEKPTEMQKQRLLAMLDRDLQTGAITSADAAFVEQIDNYKLALDVLSHRVEKNFKRKQQEAQMQQQMNAQVQVQSAQAAEQARMQAELQIIQAKAQAESQLKMLDFEREKMKKEFDLEIAKLKIDGQAEVKNMEIESQAEVDESELF